MTGLLIRFRKIAAQDSKLSFYEIRPFSFFVFMHEMEVLVLPAEKIKIVRPNAVMLTVPINCCKEFLVMFGHNFPDDEPLFKEITPVSAHKMLDAFWIRTQAVPGWHLIFKKHKRRRFTHYQ